MTNGAAFKTFQVVIVSFILKYFTQEIHQWYNNVVGVWYTSKLTSWYIYMTVIYVSWHKTSGSLQYYALPYISTGSVKKCTSFYNMLSVPECLGSIITTIIVCLECSDVWICLTQSCMFTILLTTLTPSHFLLQYRNTHTTTMPSSLWASLSVSNISHCDNMKVIKYMNQWMWKF